jgi:hypothetical protein
VLFQHYVVTRYLLQNDFYVRTDIGFSKSTKIDNKQTFYKKGGEKRLNSGITYSLGFLNIVLK